MHSRATLAADFRALGVASGDTVMLHASVRSVGRVVGGPDAIHLALGDALTAAGTLLMYAGCPRFYDEVGRGNLTAEEEAQVLAYLPAFDPLTARAARDHGVLAEFVRTAEGTRTSDHVPGKIVARFQVPVLVDGRRVWREMKEVDTSARAHPNWPDRFFAAIVERYIARAGLAAGRVGDAATFLLPARGLYEFARSEMERVARG